MIVACADDHDDGNEGYEPPEAAAQLDDEALDDDDIDEALDDDDIDEADDPRLAGAIDPQTVASTDPLLGWVLYAQPGTARLVRVDPATGIASTIATHAFAEHWLPIGVAGNKLLWQRTDTGETSLWTIDANGGYAGHVVFQPTAGWKARGIAFDQDAACPTPPAAVGTYTVLWEGPAPAGFQAQWPRPQLWHVDNAGTVTSTELFNERFPWTELRELRTTVDGFGALISRPMIQFQGGDNTNLTWYGRDANGVLLRLRTDTYTAAGGFTGCTSHQANVVCPNDFIDDAAGAGHTLTSMVTTANAGGSNTPASYLLWTKTDGTAKTLRLAPLYSGTQATPVTITTNHAGASAVSLSGKAPNLCPLQTEPQDPPAWPSDPVLDPPGCIECG